MPVQINEVVVRAVVAPDPAKGKSPKIECPPAGNSGSDAELLEKVLEIIKEKHER
ncbi:MAG TPA: DUF5908 family protein [Chitinophagaceae bacterium]|jgi:hypothetical protein